MENNQLKKKIILPKRHLSWSQFDKWKRNPKQYMAEYFENGKKLDTKYLRFGKGIAKMIEDGSYKELIPDLHVYDKPEFQVNVTYEGVNLLSYIDSYDETLNVFDEYKTGKNPWDQAKVQKHGQLLFYATALSILKGDMPFFCDLYWIETSDEPADPDDFWAQAEKKLAVTGKIVPFRRNFDEREIVRMKAEIVKVASEISEAYQKFISEL